MRIINADGSEAEMCGNGIRCFAKYVFEKGIVEVSCLTEMVQPNTKVKIIKIEKTKITVEPIN